MKRFLATLAVFAWSGVLCAQNPNSARWPGAIASDTDLLVAANNSQTVLAASIDNAVTTFLVASGTAFTAPVAITIDNEIILCTTLTANTFSGCTRGWRGTTAAPHNNVATVYGFNVDWYHNQLAAEIKALEAFMTAFTDFGSAAGTPVFQVTSRLQTFKITLSGNVASSTLQNPVQGGMLTFIVCQGPGGPFTFAFPAGFGTAAAISPETNVCTTEEFTWDGSQAVERSAGSNGLLSIVPLVPAPAGCPVGTLLWSWPDNVWSVPYWKDSACNLTHPVRTVDCSAGGTSSNVVQKINADGSETCAAGGGGGGGSPANPFSLSGSGTVATLNHNLNTTNVFSACYDTNGLELDVQKQVSSANQVIVQFLAPVNNWHCIVATGASGKYPVALTASNSYTVTGATHLLGTSNLTVTCRDAAVPANWFEPGQVTVAANNDIVITMLAAKSGGACFIQ